MFPDDNPFVNEDDALAAIYSYGHRNPQGMTVHPETGEIWENEHGPKGGDEINIIKKGKNYGWPVITYGLITAALLSQTNPLYLVWNSPIITGFLPSPPVVWHFHPPSLQKVERRFVCRVA